MYYGEHLRNVIVKWDNMASCTINLDFSIWLILSFVPANSNGYYN